MSRIAIIALRATIATLVGSPALAQPIAVPLEAQSGRSHAPFACTPDGWTGPCYTDGSVSVPAAEGP